MVNGRVMGSYCGVVAVDVKGMGYGVRGGGSRCEEKGIWAGTVGWWW